MTYLLRLSACLFLCVSLNSFGSVVSLPKNDILSFKQIHINNQNGCSPPYISMTDGCSFVTYISDGVTFLTYFEMQSGPSSADIGNDDFDVSWYGYDHYAQSILNKDENAWSFSLSVKDSTGSVASSGTSLLDKDEQGIFSVDLLGLNLLDPIAEVWVTVSGNIPLPQNNTVVEYTLSYELSEVPLPAGIYLFLSGLVGLGLMRRRS